MSYTPPGETPTPGHAGEGQHHRLGRAAVLGVPAFLFVAYGAPALIALCASFVAVPAGRLIRLRWDERTRGRLVAGEERARRLSATAIALGGAATAMSAAADGSRVIAALVLALLSAAYIVNAVLDHHVAERGLNRVLGHGKLLGAVERVDDALAWATTEKLPAFARTGSFRLLTAALCASVLVIVGLLGAREPVQTVSSVPMDGVRAVSRLLGNTGPDGVPADRRSGPTAEHPPNEQQSEPSPPTTDGQPAVEKPCEPIDTADVLIPADMAMQADGAVREIGLSSACVSGIRAWLAPRLVALDTVGGSYVILAWHDGPRLSGRDGSRRATAWWTEALVTGSHLLAEGGYPGDRMHCADGALAPVVDLGGRLTGLVGSPDYRDWFSVTGLFVSSFIDQPAGDIAIPTGPPDTTSPAGPSQTSTLGTLRPRAGTIEATWEEVNGACAG